MGKWLFWQAGFLPLVFAVLALLRAVANGGAPWRQRLRTLRRDLLTCLAALAVLLALAGVLRALGIAGASGASCQPSPNGRLCEDE